MKFFFLGLSICLIIVVLYRVLINNELLSDSYYRLIIAFGCLIAWLIIFSLKSVKAGSSRSNQQCFRFVFHRYFGGSGFG